MQVHGAQFYLPCRYAAPLARVEGPSGPLSPLLPCLPDRRVGEDFYPALPASHTAHIANAAFNSLMTAAIAFPDWDM